MNFGVALYRKLIAVGEFTEKTITKGKKIVLPNCFYDIYHHSVERKIESDLKQLILKFRNENEQNDSSDPNDILDNKIIWVMWWQKEGVPPLVQSNLAMMKKNLKYRVVLLNEENMADYLDIPSEIYTGLNEGKVTFASFSDYIRTAILYKFGGIWLDSTILVLNKENFINNINISRTPLITISGVGDFGHKFIAKDHWTVYCLGGTKGQLFFKFVNLGLKYYLIQGKKIPEYFLVDYLLDISYKNNFGGFHDEILKLKPVNLNVEKLARIMNTAFNEHEYLNLIESSSVFKLSAKKEYFTRLRSGELTYFGALQRKGKIS